MKKLFFIYFLLFCTFLNASLLEFKKGWNLVYLPNSTYLNYADIDVIWNYDSKTKKWLSYSKKNLSQNTLTKTESGKGYWVYTSLENTSLYISESSSNLDNYSYLSDGWHLLSTSKEITDFSDYYEDTKLMWVYKDGKWLIKGFGEEIENEINNNPYKYSKFNSIDKYAGYWVLKSDKHNLPETDFTISPQKDFYYLNEEITFKAKSDTNKCTWSNNLGTQQSVSKSFSSSGSYDITLSTTAKSGKVYTTTKTIRVVDSYAEPTNNLFTQTKTYSEVDEYGDKTVYRLRREGKNIVLDTEYIFTDPNLTGSFHKKSSFILKWNGSSYVGESYIENNLLGTGYFIDYPLYINSSYKYIVEKRKERIKFDFKSKEILYTMIELEKLEINNSQDLYMYTNNDEYFKDNITQSKAAYFSSIFEMEFNSAEDSYLWLNPNIKNSLFKDLGYR